MPDSPLYCTGCRTHLYTVLDVDDFAAPEVGGRHGGDAEQFAVPGLFASRRHAALMHCHQHGRLGEAAPVRVVRDVLQ